MKKSFVVTVEGPDRYFKSLKCRAEECICTEGELIAGMVHGRFETIGDYRINIAVTVKPLEVEE